MKKTESGDVEWVHCNQCLRETRHAVITVKDLKESEDLKPGFSIDWITTNTMLECRGCGNVTLRRRVVSHDVDADYTASRSRCTFMREHDWQDYPNAVMFLKENKNSNDEEHNEYERLTYKRN